jgi:hypothetical protein
LEESYFDFFLEIFKFRIHKQFPGLGYIAFCSCFVLVGQKHKKPIKFSFFIPNMYKDSTLSNFFAQGCELMSFLFAASVYSRVMANRGNQAGTATAAAGGAAQRPNGATQGKICQFKLVLLGESAVGKSSLVLRFVKGQFHEYQESTIGGKHNLISTL